MVQFICSHLPLTRGGRANSRAPLLNGDQIYLIL
jgi:hypothetical protein